MITAENGYINNTIDNMMIVKIISKFHNNGPT